MTPRARQRLLTVVLVFGGLALATGFALWGLSGRITFFYTPRELAGLSGKALTNMRLGGLVEQGSLRQEDHTNHFTLTDGTAEVEVVYEGLLPDLFREGQGILANGYYDAEKKVFVADQVLAKHDEKYMPPELKKALNEEHDKGVSMKTMVE